jgi:hypothetical protein
MVTMASLNLIFGIDFKFIGTSISGMPSVIGNPRILGQNLWRNPDPPHKQENVSKIKERLLA